MEHKMLAVIGSPGSGKTTAAIKLAQALASRKKNVVVVFCDPFTPVIPAVIPAGTVHDTSLGSLFTAPALTQKQILDACIPVRENGYISLLGYKEKENLMHYPKITRDKVLECFVSLRYLADYIILDGTTTFEADPASLVAMEAADQVLFFATASLKGLAYYEAHSSMLADNRFWTEKKMVIGNQKVGQDWEVYTNVYGGVDYVLPHTAELERQENELSLFDPLIEPDSNCFQAEINHMVQGLFALAEESPKSRVARRQKYPEQKKQQRKTTEKIWPVFSFKRRGEF